jgi:succinyl-diaminopimelate desuccinylase
MIDVANEYRKLKNSLKNIKTGFKTLETEHQNPTIVLGGKSFSGDKINTIPGKASFTIDRRINPEENIDEIKKEILQIARALEEKDPEYKINVKFLYEDPPTHFIENTVIAKNLKKEIKKVISEEAEFVLMSGASDLRYLAHKGIPIVGYSPKGSNYHADNEYVEIKSLIETSVIYYNLFTEFEI